VLFVLSGVMLVAGLLAARPGMLPAAVDKDALERAELEKEGLE
jgi:hypothetical protein